MTRDLDAFPNRREVHGSRPSPESYDLALIHHTAGVPDVASRLLAGDAPGEMPRSLEEWVTLIALEPTLDFPPGSWYRYSVAGYHILALAVERVSGESLGSFVGRRVLQPLGMGGTQRRGRVPPVLAFHVSGHRVSEEGLIVQIPDHRLGWEMRFTLDDLRRWAELTSGDAVGGEAMDRLTGTAHAYHETLKPREGDHLIVINARGTLEDGRSFRFHLTHQEDRTRSLRIRIR